MLLTDLMKYQK